MSFEGRTKRFFGSGSKMVGPVPHVPLFLIQPMSGDFPDFLRKSVKFEICRQKSKVDFQVLLSLPKNRLVLSSKLASLEVPPDLQFYKKGT